MSDVVEPSKQSHQPVMVKEILSYVRPVEKQACLLDATFGRGGHTRAFQTKYPFIKVLALDKDLTAVQYGKKHFPQGKNFFIYHEDFHFFPQKKDVYFEKHNIEVGFDWIIMDLGPSSPQLEEPQRGFSFYKNGPLDMRMNINEKISAFSIINQWSEPDLIRLFRELGEIKNPWKVVKAIVQQREISPIQETVQLAQIIEKSQGWRKKGKHPATKYFLALRLQVNNELQGLAQSLPGMIDLLKDKGRLFVLSFHSLEARIVKQIFKESFLQKKGFLVNKKVIGPSRQEVLSNSRSRSVQLRIFERSLFRKNYV